MKSKVLKFKSLMIVCLLCVMGVMNVSAQLTEAYVRSTVIGGIDAPGRGTRTAPFATIQYAYDQLSATGGTIILLSDITVTYSMTFNVNAKDFTLRSDSPDEIRTVTASGGSISMVNISHCTMTIQDVIFTNPLSGQGVFTLSDNGTIVVNDGATVSSPNGGYPVWFNFWGGSTPNRIDMNGGMITDLGVSIAPPQLYSTISGGTISHLELRDNTDVTLRTGEEGATVSNITMYSNGTRIILDPLSTEPTEVINLSVFNHIHGTTIFSGAGINDATLRAIARQINITAPSGVGAGVNGSNIVMAPSFPVTNTIANTTLSPQGTNAAITGMAYSGTLTANAGYELPATITMTIGGANFTGFTYNPATGAITVQSANVTGAIVISGTAIQGIEYFVSTGGNNTTGTGTRTAPFATIQKAYEMLPAAGGTIILLSDITTTSTLAITGKRVIVIRSDSPSAVRTISANIPDAMFTLTRSRVIVANINVTNTSTSAVSRVFTPANTGILEVRNGATISSPNGGNAVRITNGYGSMEMVGGTINNGLSLQPNSSTSSTIIGGTIDVINIITDRQKY